MRTGVVFYDDSPVLTGHYSVYTVSLNTSIMNSAPSLKPLLKAFSISNPASLPFLSRYLSNPLCSRKVGTFSFQPTEYFATITIIARTDTKSPDSLRTNFRLYFSFPQCNLYWKYEKQPQVRLLLTFNI